MRKIAFLVGLISLSIIVFTFISTAMALQYGPVLIISSTGSGAHMIFDWHIDTTSDTTYGPFNGKKVDLNTIVATYYDANFEAHTAVPYSIVLAKDSIDLYFTGKDLPGKATATNVAGSLRTGDTFFASGPGWAMGGHF